MFIFGKRKGKQFKFTEERPIIKAGPSIDENIQVIRDLFNHTDDLVVSKVTFFDRKGYVVYLQTTADTQEIERNLIQPLKKYKSRKNLEDIITSVDLEITTDLQKVVDELVQGYCAFLVESEKNIYT